MKSVGRKWANFVSPGLSIAEVAKSEWL